MAQRIFIVGGQGFVGSAYARLLIAAGHDVTIITRANWADYAGQSCDVLINAAGNSKKYLSNREPLTDFDGNVRDICRMLADFQSGTYVLLSSGDVYPDQTSPLTTREDQSIALEKCSRYGLHKHLGEDLVRGVHPRWLIIRMGGFVGPGMKKNAIFDMLNNAPVWLHPDSQLQFTGTDTGARTVWSLVEKGVRNQIVNLGTRGLVHLGSLHKRLGSQSVFQENAPLIRYELSLDKLEQLTGTPMPQAETDVAHFLAGIGRQI